MWSGESVNYYKMLSQVLKLTLCKSPGHRITPIAQVRGGGWGVGVGRESAFVNMTGK